MPRLEAAERATSAPTVESAPAPQPTARRLTVGAADDRAELEADRVADQVIAGLGTRMTASGVAPDRSGVRPGTNSDHSRVRRSTLAAPAAAPTAPAIRRATVAPGHQQVVVRRKLSGTTAAVKAQAGDATTKSKMSAKFAKFTSKFKKDKGTGAAGSGKYAQILADLASYETTEKKYLALKQTVLTEKQKTDLLGRLRGVEALTVAWLDQHQDAATETSTAVGTLDDLLNLVGLPESEATPRFRSDPKRMEAWQYINANINMETDGPAKQSQVVTDYMRSSESPEGKTFHALKMLLPRIRNEIMEIQLGRFYRSDTYSDETLNTAESKDDAFGGALNRLDQVTHGDSKGVFIQDKSFAMTGNVGSKLGISQVDPNAGARSVAMYELAKLLDLGVNVIAKTEFATHKSDTNYKGQKLDAPVDKLGVRMEMAPGKEAGQTATELTTGSAREKGGDTVSLEDPVLQRSLNALQLIDAIAGQLDRHWANYYIATDGEGKVTGVVGIDLDMAFAKDHTTVTAKTGEGSDPMKDSHFVGLPKLVDSEFATKIGRVSATDVKKLLLNYLEPSEVEATMIRFKLVQDACLKLLTARGEGKLVDPSAWGAETAKAQMQEPGGSYLGVMATGKVNGEFSKPMTDLVKRVTRANPEIRQLDIFVQRLEGEILAQRLTVAEATTLASSGLNTFATLTDAREKKAALETLTTEKFVYWNMDWPGPEQPFDQMLLNICGED